MSQCSATTRSGARCKGVAIDGLGLCVSHHPEFAHARRRNASRGGKRGGRGRRSPATAELARLQEHFEDLAENVLAGTLDRGKAAVAIQALNGARACVRDAVAAREQEEIAQRLDALEDELAEPETGRRGV